VKVDVIFQSEAPVTLVGGGPVGLALLRQTQRSAPGLVAADGGARACLRAGLMPDAVIGDFDSLRAADRAAIPPDRLHRVAEQETTDFDKALRSIRAPLVLALGFTGARLDHGLAVMNALVRRPEPCIVIGPRDVVFHLAGPVTLALRAGDRVSLFPMARVTGRSAGLHWPIDGLTLAPDGLTGTSNRATGPVTLVPGGPGLLAILPRARLPAAIAALRR
jgi:thiamine pyrophosphokinase